VPAGLQLHAIGVLLRDVGQFDFAWAAAEKSHRRRLKSGIGGSGAAPVISVVGGPKSHGLLPRPTSRNRLDLRDGEHVRVPVERSLGAA